MIQWGNRVAYFRNEKGVLQEELASSIGMNRVVLSHIENGKRRLKLDDAIAIAKRLGISMDEFCADEICVRI